MKAFGYLQITMTPSDRQKGQISTNRPVTEKQWEAIKRILHIGHSSDVVALPDEVPDSVKDLFDSEGISNSKFEHELVWERLKEALLQLEE